MKLKFSAPECPLRRLLVRSALLSAVMAAPGVHADERLFTYSYEADVLPKSGLEFEQWVTHRNGKDDGVFTRWDLREELEYGITDRLTTALYLNFRSTYSDGVTGRADGNEFEFNGLSSEWKYQLMSPQTDPLGLLVYGEATYSGEELELEQKVVLQKNLWDNWELVFNATAEQEWEFEGGGTEEELKVELSTGLAYRLNTHWAVGLEALNVRTFPDFGGPEADGYFAGPAVHYGSSKWWATATVLSQIAGTPESSDGLNLDEFERVQVRLILGFNF